MRLRFSPKHFFFFIAILAVELGIALFVHDGFVRPFVGDVLVVLLIYFFAKAFLETKHDKLLAAGVLLFAYLVETGQYFNLVSRLGLAESRIATIVMGTSFDWKDILAYTVGFGLILFGQRALFQESACPGAGGKLRHPDLRQDKAN